VLSMFFMGPINYLSASFLKGLQTEVINLS